MNMERSRGSRPIAAALALAFAAAVLCFVAPAAADSNGSAHGQILNMEGKPWANLTIVFVSSQGQQTEVKTDKNGNYSVRGLAPGDYSVRFMIPETATPLELKAKIKSGEDAAFYVNFKEQAGAIAAAKKQDEASKKFESMKAHFDAGKGFLKEARDTRAELQTAPPDQRDALKQKFSSLSGQAVTESEAARQAASEKDPNMHLIWAQLGDAYDLAGRDDDALKAYEQAIALKPDVATNYNNLGNLLARQGKTEEAGKMYAKSVELDPPNAATAWLNFGVVLYNAQRMKEAVEPLKKATELDPKNAKGWYLLGTCLISLIEYKQEGDKQVPSIPPGTVEALQKAVELDPNGTYGKESKNMLDNLQQIAPGIDTSYGPKRKKR
jgi:tetratricopeptide (TPR) repeat protein